jgi:hypothetical protein
MDIFCRRGITDGTDGHFGRGGNEKGLIITARYWGLDFSVSEVLYWNYGKADCHTAGRGIFWRCSIFQTGGSMCVYSGFPPKY